MTEAFKICSMCHMTWWCREDFLADPAVKVVGYQVNTTEPLNGFFLFNHNIPECGSTFSIQPEVFRDLHEGPMYKENLYGKEGCPGYCLYENNLLPCPEKCECAYVRDVLQVIRNWPKRTPLEGG